jgi:hypothetical protein
MSLLGPIYVIPIVQKDESKYLSADVLAQLSP